MTLPYSVVVKPAEDAVSEAHIKEFPSCAAHGDMLDKAMENLRGTQQLWIEESISAGFAIPLPESDEELPSGKWPFAEKVHFSQISAFIATLNP